MRAGTGIPVLVVAVPDDFETEGQEARVQIVGDRLVQADPSRSRSLGQGPSHNSRKRQAGLSANPTDVLAAFVILRGRLQMFEH
jgi:hypothetical protein